MASKQAVIATVIYINVDRSSYTAMRFNYSCFDECVLSYSKECIRQEAQLVYIFSLVTGHFSDGAYVGTAVHILCCHGYICGITCLRARARMRVHARIYQVLSGFLECQSGVVIGIYMYIII